MLILSLGESKQKEKWRRVSMARVEEEDKGGRNLLSRFVLQTGTKGPSFVPVRNTNRDKRFRTSAAVGRRPFVPVRGWNRD